MYLIKSYYLNQFNCFGSDVLPFALRVEDGERLSQSHSREYDWLGPYPMLNTQGRLYPYIPGSLN